MKAYALLFAVFATAATAWAQDKDAELAKQLSNPASSLISAPFQSNLDFRMGPLSVGWKYTMNFQPVIPVSLNQNWNLIIRTIVPYIHQEDVFKGSAANFEELINDVPVDLTSKQVDTNSPAATPAPAAKSVAPTAKQLKDLRNAIKNAVASRLPGHVQDGLGDITQSFFFSPKAPGPGGVIWGLGPVFLYPSATDNLLGSEKWGAGPTGLLLKQEGGWTYGVLANQLWSFAGKEGRSSVNATFVQPFLSYQTKTKTTFGVNAEATYDWSESQWTIPLNLSVTQLVRIGKLPVSFSVGGKYYADGPEGAPQWGLRLVVTPLFPLGGKPPSPPENQSYAK